MALSLITDRTAADVAGLKALRNKINATSWASLTAAEQATWTAGKGANNATDLNRVESAVAYLAGLLKGYGYWPNTTSFITSWTEGDTAVDPSEFNEADAARYLANVAAIKATLSGTTILPASLNNLTPEQQNNIEKALLEIEIYIDRVVAAFRHTGAAISGQEGLIL